MNDGLDREADALSVLDHEKQSTESLTRMRYLLGVSNHDSAVATEGARADVMELES